MLLTIFMLVYIFLLLLTAWYMWHRRSGAFLTYDVGSNPHLERVLTVTAICLLLEAILGIFLLFLTSRYFNLITLILSCLTLLFFGLVINQNK